MYIYMKSYVLILDICMFLMQLYHFIKNTAMFSFTVIYDSVCDKARTFENLAETVVQLHCVALRCWFLCECS